MVDEDKAMTDEELAEYEALAKNATPGPWEMQRGMDEYFVDARHPVESYNVCIAVIDGGLSNDSKADAALIAASRTAIPKLIAEVRRLQATAKAKAYRYSYHECED